MARQARKQLADMRAMAHQAERQNIIDPRQPSTAELFEESDYANELTGVSGLVGPVGAPAPYKDNSAMMGAPPPNPYTDDEGKPRHGTETHLVLGSGKAHGEAHEMGKKLREYLTKLHGHGYAEAFAGGCGCSGSGATPTMGLSQVRGGLNLSGNVEQSGSYEGLGRRVGGRKPKEAEECDAEGGEFDYNTFTCSTSKPAPFKPVPAIPGKPDTPSAKPANLKVPLWVASKDYPMGSVVRIHTIGSQLDALWSATANVAKGSPKPAVDNPLWKKVSDTALGAKKMKGKGRVVGGSRMVGGHCPTQAHLREEVDGSGKASATCGGKKKRASAQPGSGRSRRAEIVKKVMREKGLKMIEASKYVKQHGLY